MMRFSLSPRQNDLYDYNNFIITPSHVMIIVNYYYDGFNFFKFSPHRLNIVIRYYARVDDRLSIV